MKFVSSFAIVVLIMAHGALAVTTSVIWLDITPGARANGIGESFTAVADDATASYWNPAGLAFQEEGAREITLQHSQWLPQLADDLYYEFLGYAQHLEGWGGVGGNITFMSMGEQQEIEAGSTEPIGTFYTYGISADAAFGTEVAPGLAVGLGLKFIYDHLYYKENGKGSSFAADLGVLYHAPEQSFGNISLGATVSNLGPNMSYGGNSENNPLPRKFKIGFAYVPFEDELTSLLIAADYTKLLVEIEDGISEEVKDNKWGTGAEFWYYNLLALRAGYVHDTEGESTISGVSFGAGLHWNDFQLDMAFVPVDKSLQGSGKYNQKYSLTLQF
ncbi:MAG: PorV/PorQ family protein [Candidatus Fermentibacteraceae bacterium]|nr:PorV/PorQ family protein [Candidatus Fermentibacteraceae bacterium]